MDLTKEAGYLIFMEDQNDPNVIGVFWGRLGTIDVLTNLYREQRPHAHFAACVSCTRREYAALLPTFDPIRLSGIWHRRAGSIERLMRGIGEHDRTERAATEADLATGGSTNPRRKHHYTRAGYAEAAAAC